MKELKIILLIVGTIIGAGTVSGKEVASFFTKFGLISYIFILPLYLLLFYFINKLLLLGSKTKINTTNQLNLIIFKKNNKIIKFFTFISFIILSATMFSGITTSLNLTEISVKYILVLSIIVFVICLIVHKDIQSITNLCTIIMPIIFIAMLYVSFTNITFPLANILTTNIVILPYNIFSYVCRNIFLSYFVITKSSYGLNEKQCKKISILTSLILCIIISVIITTELSNVGIIDFSMPYLCLAQKNTIIYIFYFICLQFAIITTLTSTLITLKSFFNFKNKYLNTLIPCIICALISFVKFDIFVEYLYPVIGMFGFYLIYYLVPLKLPFQNSNKNIHQACNKTQNNCTAHN